MPMTIAEIQRALITRGYDLGKGGADGDAGPKTIAAVTAFQRLAGLVPDGIAGPLTQDALRRVEVTQQRREVDVPPWLVLARAEIGIREGSGAANNARVVKLFADSGFPGIKADSVAWCAAAVGAMLKRAGFEPSGSLAARSYETWGVGLAAPVLGCVGTKKRGGSSWQGHVGFVVGASSSSIILLGGNQGDSWSVASFKRSEFTSYRWPKGAPIPSDKHLPTTVAGARSGVSEA